MGYFRGGDDVAASSRSNGLLSAIIVGNLVLINRPRGVV
jgi:hypothetical protein